MFQTAKSLFKIFTATKTKICTFGSSGDIHIHTFHTTKTHPYTISQQKVK